MKVNPKIAAAVGFIVLLMIYLFGMVYYRTHMFPNTTLYNVNIGQLSKADAVERLNQFALEEQYTFEEKDSITYTYTASELGLIPHSSEQADRILNAQKTWQWPAYLLGQSNIVKDLTIVIDDNAWQKLLMRYSEDPKRVKTLNAYIQWENDAYQIIPERPGTEIDPTYLKGALAQMFLSKEKKFNVEKAYKKPTIKADNPELLQTMETIDSYSDLTITYRFPRGAETVPKETLRQWIYTDQSGNVSVDGDLVSKYLLEIADKNNTFNNYRTFISTMNGSVQVPPGTLGFTVNVAEETALITEHILAKKDQDRLPLTKGSGVTTDYDDIGYTYIEVDIQNQHLWYYLDGALIFDSPIISGLTKPGFETPRGAFYLWNKERNAVLRGLKDPNVPDLGSYATPVGYWMPIDWTGIGLHDSPWQSNYGGQTYTWRGSHGCINLPPPIAERIFNEVAIGTPVIIHS